MKLTITAEASHPSFADGLSPTQQISDLMAAIGYSRGSSVRQEALTSTSGPSVLSVSADVPDAAPQPSVMDEPSVQAVVAKRERGKPAPGRKRRTAEEVAEDEAAEKPTAAEMSEHYDQQNAEIDAQLAVSTGEARVGPEDESEEDQIQDIADEHAEVAANTPADAPATLEDVRAVMGEYMTIYGMPAVQADGQVIVKGVLGPVPAGTLDPKGNPTETWAMSKFPEARYGDIVAAFRKAVAENPFSRDRVS